MSLSLFHLKVNVKNSLPLKIFVYMVFWNRREERREEEEAKREEEEERREEEEERREKRRRRRRREKERNRRVQINIEQQFEPFTSLY